LEPVTHFLTGAVLAGAGFNRKTALATATMTLAAEAPDLDVFWGFKGPVYGFAHHRGFTHSFLGLILTSAVVTGFMYLIWRLRGRKTNIPGLLPRWRLLFLFAYIAGLSHILLDYTNNYGVRPFWPFWERWYSWGVAFIFEPPMFVLLLAALVTPLVFSPAKRPQQIRGTAVARVTLICILGIWLVRAYQATGIVRTLKREQFKSEAPLRVSAYPYWTRVSRWRIGLRWAAVIETRSFLVTSDVAPSTGELDATEEVTLHKPSDTPVILAAKRSYLGRVYLDWAEYPLLSTTEDGQDTVVHFRDLRFGYPQLNRNTLLTASVTLDRNLHVVREAMGVRQQVPPID
jgi:inner membrane protein